MASYIDCCCAVCVYTVNVHSLHQRESVILWCHYSNPHGEWLWDRAATEVYINTKCYRLHCRDLINIFYMAMFFLFQNALIKVGSRRDSISGNDIPNSFTETCSQIRTQTLYRGVARQLHQSAFNQTYSTVYSISRILNSKYGGQYPPK